MGDENWNPRGKEALEEVSEPSVLNARISALEGRVVEVSVWSDDQFGSCLVSTCGELLRVDDPATDLAGAGEIALDYILRLSGQLSTEISIFPADVVEVAEFDRGGVALSFRQFVLTIAPPERRWID